MQKLKDAGVDSPRRDCMVLIEDLLTKDRSWVNAHADFELSAEQIKVLDAQISRRIKREPLAYIRGKAWFYGRFFQVDPNVMVPRPESEAFIELLKTIKPKTIIDIGTGSGCLAITAKLELPKSQVIASDIDDKALKIAQRNAKKYNADIKFIQGSLLEPIKGLDFYSATIITNLPYVPDGLVTSGEIKYEPKNALFSGKDGLDHYRNFWEQIMELSSKPRYVLAESLEDQHQKLNKMAESSDYKLTKKDILVQQFELF